MNFKRNFPIVGVILTIVGIGLLSIDDLNSYLDPYRFALNEKELLPNDFREGSIELLADTEVGVLVVHGPYDGSSINLSILSKDNSIVWEKHHVKEGGNRLYSTFVNKDTGNYVVKITNTGDKPTYVSALVSSHRPDQNNLDFPDTYFLFEIPGDIVLRLGIFLLLFCLPFYFYDLKKSKKI